MDLTQLVTQPTTIHIHLPPIVLAILHLTIIQLIKLQVLITQMVLQIITIQEIIDIFHQNYN